jgi:hypothetical protein
MAATPFPGLPLLFEASRYRARASASVVLGDDERLSVYPIGVTQHAERSDLELIGRPNRAKTELRQNWSRIFLGGLSALVTIVCSMVVRRSSRRSLDSNGR